MCRVKVNSSLGGSFDPAADNAAAGNQNRVFAARIDNRQFQIAVEWRGGYFVLPHKFSPTHKQVHRPQDRRFSPILLSTAKNLIFACSKPLDRCDVPSDKGTYNRAGVAFNDEIKRNPGCLLANIVRFVRLSRRSQKKPCKYDTQNEIRLDLWEMRYDFEKDERAGDSFPHRGRDG